MTVDDLLVHYVRELEDLCLSPRTVRDYERCVRALDRDLPYGADAATEDELRVWLRREHLAPATRAAYYAAIRSFYRWATSKGVLTYDPSDEIPRPRVPEGLPRTAATQQVHWLVTEAAEPYRLWAQLAAYAGLRCIEIYRLRREHITQECIKVHKGKGDKARVVPTHRLIWAAVKEYPPGPLAQVPSERRLSALFWNYCHDVLGMDEISLHPIRGWFATASYLKTRDIQGLRRTLGHTNIATTARYISVADEQLQAIIEAVPTFGVESGDASAQVTHRSVRR